VLLLERLERLAIADWQTAAGQHAENLPSLAAHVQGQREQFEAALVDEPKRLRPVDVERMELRRALGVA
jgi:hypothetical protein